jgi:hypothetical protein
MPDLEARLRRLEDRAEIADLVVRYFIAADDDDYGAIGACFADDGQFSAGGFPGGSSREQIVDFIRTDRQDMGATVHTPNYVLTAFHDDDRASGVIGAHLELARGGAMLFGAVRYIDEYARRNGRWQITRREMRTIHVAPWKQVGESFTSEHPVRWPGLEPLPSDK